MQGKTIKTLPLHRGNLGKVYDLGRKYLGKVSEMSPKCLGKVYSSYLNIGKIKFPKLWSNINYVKYVKLIVSEFW